MFQQPANDAEVVIFSDEELSRGCIPGGNCGLKWWEKDCESPICEIDADIDIPLVLQGGQVVVEDTEDVYSMPTSSSVTITKTYTIQNSSLTTYPDDPIVSSCMIF